MDKQELLKTCAECLLEVAPMLRGTFNSYIHKEVDRTQWVTPGQTRLLYLIDQGVINISALALRQKTSAPTISRQVDCLVEKGMVVRERQRDDRRVVTLTLTPRGKEVLYSIMQSTREWIAQNLAALETAQLEEIIQSLELLREIFKPGTK